jgi:predicted enzyme related to lactoylglutathione lyase
MNSLVVFSLDVGRLAAFYEAVFGMRVAPDAFGGVRLHGEGGDVLLHPVPAAIAATMQMRTPPEPRDGCAIKPVFDVGSLDLALQTVTTRGGGDTGRTFRVGDFTLHDVLDPDGNVIQLREKGSLPSR